MVLKQRDEKVSFLIAAGKHNSSFYLNAAGGDLVSHVGSLL